MAAVETTALRNADEVDSIKKTKDTSAPDQHPEEVEHPAISEEKKQTDHEDSHEDSSDSEKAIDSKEKRLKQDGEANVNSEDDKPSETAKVTEDDENKHKPDLQKKRESISLLDASKILEEQDKMKPENSHVGTVQHLGEDAVDESKKKDANSYQVNYIIKKPTLLDLSNLYRKQHPDKVRQRIQEQTRRLDESYGIYERDTFIENYYIEMERARREELEEADHKKHASPQIEVTLKFNLPQQHKRGFAKHYGTYKSLKADGLFIFHRNETTIDKLKEAEGSIRDETRGDETELLIHVSNGKYLNNKLRERDHELVYNATLRCNVVAPESGKNSVTEHTSKPYYITTKGTAFWDYVFVLKGYTVEQLRQSFVVLTVAGKFHHDDDDKSASSNSPKAEKHHKFSFHLPHVGGHSVEVGKSVLGAYRAPKKENWKRTHSSRSKQNTESASWAKALRNPGVTIPIVLILHEKTEDLPNISTLIKPGDMYNQHSIHKPEDPVEVHEPKEEKEKSIFKLSFHHHHKKEKEDLPSISQLVKPSAKLQRSDSIGDADDITEEPKEKSKLSFGLLHHHKKKHDNRKLSTSSRGSISTLRSDTGSINEETGSLAESDESNTPKEKSKFNFGFHHKKKKDEDLPSISQLVKPSTKLHRSDSIGDADDIAEEPKTKSKLSFGLLKKNKKDNRKLSTSSRGSISTLRSDTGSINEETGSLAESDESNTPKEKSKLHLGFHHKKKKDGDQRKLSTASAASIDSSSLADDNVKGTSKQDEDKNQTAEPKEKSKFQLSFHHHHHKKKEGSVSSQSGEDGSVRAPEENSKEGEETKEKSKSHFGFHNKKKKEDLPKISSLVRPSVDLSASKDDNEPEKTPTSEKHKSKHHLSFSHHHHHKKEEE